MIYPQQSARCSSKHTFETIEAPKLKFAPKPNQATSESTTLRSHCSPTKPTSQCD